MGLSPLEGTPQAACGSIIMPLMNAGFCPRGRAINRSRLRSPIGNKTSFHYHHGEKAHHALFKFLCWSLAQKSLRSWRQKTSRSDKNGKFHSIDIQLSSCSEGDSLWFISDISGELSNSTRFSFTLNGVNINQICKRINSTDRVYAEDVAELRNRMNEVWKLLFKAVETPKY